MSVERRGIVTQAVVSPGSKSERQAVVLDTDDQRYVLRRRGGNPFKDTVLDSLVGKRLRVVGDVHGSNFILTDWSELDT
jgi:hypothetical protein